MKARKQPYNQIERCICAVLCLCLALAFSFALAVRPIPHAHAEEILLEETTGHVHTDSCYSIGNHLVCGMEEGPGHQHTEDCWQLVRGDLWCTDNTGSHIHTDDCYHWTKELACGMEEGEGAHTHTEDCYEQERVLICGQETDILEENGLSDIEEIIEEEKLAEEEIEDELVILTEPEPEPEPEAEAVPEASEEPTMNPGGGIVSLLQMERELNFAGKSDPTADVEDEVDWWKMFVDMPLSGIWADDLIKVAESQIGYTESELNYVAEDPDHPKGYTRYGAWYGIPYGDWCAMFICFCMYYADIPETAVPYNPYCSEWVRALSERGMYRNWDEGYKPKPGDFVFFDFDMDEKAEHVGIIRDIDWDRGWIYTIEGNRYDYVEEFVLTMDDYSIIGYGVLPENPAYDPYIPVVRRNGEVEIPPEEPEPTPPSWENISEAAAGIKEVNITPTIESSWVTY